MFQSKDRTKKEHKHGLVYHAKCSECNEGYVRATGRRMQDYDDEHPGKDSKSNFLRHSYQVDHVKQFPNIKIQEEIVGGIIY